MLTHLHEAGEPWQGWAAPRALPQVGGTGRPLFVSIYQGLEAKEGEMRKQLKLLTSLPPPSAARACGNVLPCLLNYMKTQEPWGTGNKSS